MPELRSQSKVPIPAASTASPKMTWLVSYSPLRAESSSSATADAAICCSSVTSPSDHARAVGSKTHKAPTT